MSFANVGSSACLPPQRLRVATACSGSDVCALTVEMILHELKDALNLTGLEVDHVWSCESEPFKRDFLESVMDVKAIYLDIRSLGCRSAFNVVTFKEELIPELGVLIVGWSCKDFSSPSSRGIARRLRACRACSRKAVAPAAPPSTGSLPLLPSIDRKQW